MKNAIVGISLVATVCFLPQCALSQDLASQIVGVWKRTSQVQKEIATGTTNHTYGEKVSGPAIFTRGGHFMWVIAGEGRKPAAAPVATDAERIALFNSLAYGSGTYKVEGNKVHLRYDTSWNEGWTGTERVAEMQVSGKTLTWTSPPIRTLDGKDVVAIITMERLE
jgi:hypothetical protein